MPKSLAVKVTEKLSTIDASTYEFSPAVQDALRLSDIFESVKPVQHILPLDAMAGFQASGTTAVESRPDLDFFGSPSI